MPALQADAICRGVQAPSAACFLTCVSVTPKQLQTYTRVTSRRGPKVVPYRDQDVRLAGEANLTLPGSQGPEKWCGARIVCDPRPTTRAGKRRNSW
ncbi:hypothetical protein GCM10023084_65720 [Streptomyces lacrimifluminis]|uniref:Uncharacterized protein n=1 Tax=Streptomyces lacrimifluminis TaxID=1500077 RepID=A0A917P386_9ACTN|nr:hypothetical protein GCM10012282_66200 [Streptomyces lacrimifluminis]